MTIRMRIGDRLFFSHLMAIVLVSGSIGTYFYFSASRSLLNSLRARLQNSAALMAQVFNAEELDAIRAPADQASPAYQRNLALLRTLRRTNSDIAYLYVMRHEGSQLSFVLDSDETDQQAPPGKEYTPVPPAMRAGFFKPSADEDICEDEWGSTMSGYAPLNAAAGRYLIGMDMRADEVRQKFRRLRMSGMISLAASLVLALAFGRFMSRHFVRHIRIFSDRCQAVARGDLYERIAVRTGDELDGLIDSFNTMAGKLEQTHREIKQSRDDLDVRVKERTRDLTEANRLLTEEIAERQRLEDNLRKTVAALQDAMSNVRVLTGLLPICAGCKKIRNDKGYWTQVEEFMEQHSEARFSHGLCPDCMARMFPNYTTPKTV